MPDPGLMPLPDAAADLDWSNLVDAAKAYEGESTRERGPAPASAGHAGVNALVSLSTGLPRTQGSTPRCWHVTEHPAGLTSPPLSL